MQIPSRWERDSFLVYQGSQHILDWFSGRTRAIGEVHAFPLFQYLISLAVLLANAHGLPINLFWVWSTCSTLSLVGIITLFGVVSARMNYRALGWAMAAVLLSGPLLFYAPSTFNELPAAFLTLTFTAAVTGSCNVILCAALFWLSGITKEIAPPLLALIWIGSIGINRTKLNRPTQRSQLATLGVSFLVTVGTNCAFNLLRYNTALNRENLLPNRIVESWPRRLHYCVALWISPNGGVFAFWPTFGIFMVGVIAIAVHRKLSKLPAIVAVSVLAFLTVGLSAWFGPFGWWSWGPRLMLPWLPAGMFLILRGYPDACEALVIRLLSQARHFRWTATVTLLAALPHVLATPKPQVVWNFFANDSRFPNDFDPDRPEEYYARNRYLAWRKTPPILLRPFIDDLDVQQFVLTAGFLASLFVLLWECRVNCRREDLVAHTPASQPPPNALYNATKSVDTA